ncbi:hypothetical protein BTA31_12090 [Bacillus haynesii]|uniref:Transposase n=1 Tax=Bacillus haynesii TaxID=1925021 RepID=A0ABX3I5E3_9BACI|nr:hypothetical protein BTA31_12090 [Bacillus haynesii]
MFSWVKCIIILASRQFVKQANELPARQGHVTMQLFDDFRTIDSLCIQRTRKGILNDMTEV